MKTIYILMFFLFFGLISKLNSQVYTIGSDTIYKIQNDYYFINELDTTKVDRYSIIIKFVNNVSEAEKSIFGTRYSIIENFITSGGFVHYIVPDTLNYIDLGNSILSDPIVSVLELNVMVKLYSFVPNDVAIQDSWYLYKTEVFDAWDFTTGDDNITIAIIDDAFSWDHQDMCIDQNGYTSFFSNPGEDEWNPWNYPGGGNGLDGSDPYEYIDDLRGLDLYEWVGSPQFTIEDNDVRPEIGSWPPDWHGTAMSGLIGAKTNNSIDGAGIAGGNILDGKEGVKILPIKIWDWAYDGYFGVWHPSTSTDNISLAIDYAVSLVAKVVFMPFGVVNGGYDAFQSIMAAIDNGYSNNNVVFVAAVGNENHNFISFPARYEYVIAVGGSNANDERWGEEPGWGSNTGNEIELVAPSDDIFVLTGTDGINFIDGTSCSSAMVTATVGLMLSVNPFLTNEEIREILHNTSEKVGENPYNNNGWNEYMGYGRLNVCKAVSTALKYTEEEFITSTTTWNDPKMISHNVYISPQCTLTIKNTVRMGTYFDEQGIEQKAKIIVMGGIDNYGIQNDASGGTLIVDGGKLTNLENCDESDILWGGVEVWGIKSKSQFKQDGFYYQGKLILINGAIIENAVSAVELCRPGFINTTTGGIISATNSIFRNNAKSFHAINYNNYNPATGAVMDNLSSFKNCTFELNNDYLAEYTFYKHVDLDRVKGIKFMGTDFSLSGTNGVDAWKKAIASYSAGFSVTAICNSPSLPCRDFDKCSFNGFYDAIYATNNWSNNNTFNVNNAIFTNNTNGIRMNGVNNATVLFSEFNIGYNAADQEECEGKGSGYGIDMTGCTGFAIEENHFYSTSPGGLKTGIRIAETQSTDQVYKNTFTGLSYGNYAVGKNFRQPNVFHEGLAYYCNDNTANYTDIYVEPDGSPLVTSGIQSKQGDDDYVAGNKFTPSGVTWHFYNGGDYLVGYYFCDYCSNENPDDDKEFYVTDKPKGFDNDCPSHYGGGGGGGTGRGIVLTPGEKQEAEMEFATNLADYNNVKTLYDNLKDGGNTEATITDIETAWPSDMWELRAELLGKSPHLSMEVLKATADKTDVLPDNVIFEIMAANPDELKKEELIKYLEDKANPLPEYMVNILRQVAEGSTYKTILEQEMAHYNQMKTRAAYDIIRSNLNDSVTNMTELRNWLDNIGGKRTDEQIIASYIAENNYTDALALANIMPALYGFTGYELTEHYYYMDMLNFQIQLMQEGRTVNELDSNEVSNLVIIAENSTGTAGAQAKGILEFAYGYHFCNCLSVSDSAGFKSSGMINPEDFAKAYGLEITTEPNPASEWVAFNYTLPYDKSDGIIRIVDTKGTFVNSFEINGLQGQKVWDTRKLNSGVYFYTLSVGEFTRSGKIVISK